MLRRNGPREWIVTILLVSLVIWSWGLGWNSIPGSTHQVEQGAGTFHRRKVRKHRRIKLLQVATRLATQRLIVRVSWCAIAVIALYRSPWSACSTEWPYFLVLGVVSKSSRIETTETENAYVSQFLGSVRIEVPKDDKEGLKLLAAFLRYFVVPPAPRCHGHTLSLREVSQCTHFSPSTVRDIYHRVDAHGLKALLRKHNPNSAIPEDVKERIIQMQIDDPSASGRVLAARLRESNPECQILAEDVASCVVSMDYNEIRPAVRKALGAKSASSYLIDQLFQINKVLLTHAKDLPKSILVQISALSTKSIAIPSAHLGPSTRPRTLRPIRSVDSGRSRLSGGISQEIQILPCPVHTAIARESGSKRLERRLQRPRGGQFSLQSPFDTTV